MSNSIGEISLDLGLNDITEKQINNISGKIKSNITKVLSTLGDIGNVNKTLDNIQNTVKKMIDSIHSEIKSNLSELKGYIENMFSNIKVKNPMENFLNKDSIATNENDISAKTSRGPPIGVKVPKVDLSNNAEYIKSQLENLTVQLDQVGAKADEERYKIKDLRKEIENLSKPTGNKVMDFINQEQIKKLQVELSKADQRLNKFASTSDKTVFTIDALEKKLDELADVAGNSNRKFLGLGNVFSNINKKISDSIKLGIGNIKNTVNSNLDFSNRLKKESNNVRRILNKGFNFGIGNKLKKLSHISRNTGRSFLGMGNMISKSFTRVLRQVLVIRVMYRALRGLISYTGSALMTNKQFAHSLNQIRTNLMVAFMPIYQAVLPALNALMSALSTVTAYIATFISAIFGKTYKQSFNAAKGLNKAKAAVGAYGKSAKKAGADTKKAAKDMEEMKGALMGFDEINQLDLDKGKKDKGDSDGSGIPPMVMPDIDVSPASIAGKTIEDMVNKIKAVMAAIFQPFKNAWESEGQATIKSIKYALHSILDLLGSIGKSMLTVWTNGTGEKILIVILQILQNIFNIIGDIATIFATAWNSGDIGTKIIQGLANTFLNLLTLVKKIGDSFREVWGEIGTPLANMFMKVLKSTTDVLENLSQKLIYVWDNGGNHLFQGFIRLGAKIFELVGFIYTEFIVPFVNWFLDWIAPAVANVIELIGKLLDKFTELIDWLMGDGKPVLDIIVTVLGSMAAAFGIVKGAVTLYHGVIKIATGVSKIFGLAVAWLTSPFGIAVTAITAAIAVGVLLYKNWDTIKAKAISIFTVVKDFIVNAFTSIKNKTVEIWTNIGNWLKDIWNGIKQAAINLFTSIKDFIVKIFTTVKNKIIEIWSNITSWLSNTWNRIKTNVEHFFGLIKEFIINVFTTIKDRIVELWTIIGEWLNDKWTSIKSNVESLFGAIKEFIINVFNGIKNTVVEVWTFLGNWLSNIWNGIKTTSSTVFNGIKNIIVTIFDTIKNIVVGIWDTIVLKLTGAFSKISKSAETIFEGMKNFLKGICDSIGGFFKGMVNGVIKALNFMIEGLNNLHVDIPDWVPGLGGKSLGFTIPKIPMLARGGIIDQPTLSMVGEAGKEAVVPLENNTGWMDKISESVANAIIAAMEFNSDNSNEKNHGDVVMQLDGVTFARVIKSYTDKENQRIGNNVIIQTT